MKIQICRRYIQIFGIISVLSLSNLVYAETVVHNERVIQQDIQKKQEIAKAEQEKRKKEEIERKKAEDEKRKNEELEQKKMQEENRKKEALERKKAQEEKQRLERINKEKAEKQRLEELYNQQPSTESQETKQVQPNVSSKEIQQNNQIVHSKNSSVQTPTSNSSKSKIQTIYLEVPLSPTATLPSKQEKIKKVCDRVNAKYDEMKNVTYYSPKRISPDPIALYPYIEVNHTNRTMRLIYRSVYIGTHSYAINHGLWVQMGEAKNINYHTVIVRADNKLYEMRYDPRRKSQDVISESPMIQGGIFGYSNSLSVVEGYTEIMDQNAFEVFKAVANAKEVKMRFAGDNRQIDKKMSKKLKEIHEEIWKIFNILQNE